MMDLTTFIDKSRSECLNEDDDHPYAHCLTSAGGFLQSDCDEQIILSLSFNQSVKIHSLKIKAPTDKGPKTVRGRKETYFCLNRHLILAESVSKSAQYLGF